MPSSPAEPILNAIIADYQTASELLHGDDLAALERLLEKVERRLNKLPPPSGQPTESALRTEAIRQHENLVAEIRAAQDALTPHLRQVREGRRALRGYRASTESPSTN